MPKVKYMRLDKVAEQADWSYSKIYRDMRKGLLGEPLMENHVMYVPTKAVRRYLSRRGQEKTIRLNRYLNVTKYLLENEIDFTVNWDNRGVFFFVTQEASASNPDIANKFLRKNGFSVDYDHSDSTTACFSMRFRERQYH